jgi:hypothetical protein
LKQRSDPVHLGPGRFGLALLPATDYTQSNNILSLQMVGRWPTFLLSGLLSEDLLPEDQSPATLPVGGLAGGNGKIATWLNHGSVRSLKMRWKILVSISSGCSIPV